MNTIKYKKTLKVQEANQQLKPRRFFLIPLVIGFLGFLLIMLATAKFGVGISGDSADYILWAHNFIETHSFTKPDGSSLIILPPLYSVLIAVFKLFWINEFLAVRLINAISFLFVIFLSGLWILRYLGSLFFAIAGSFLILFSYPLISVYSWAWSEPLFILIVMIFLFLLPTAVSNPTYKIAIILGILTSAACLTRYVGFVLLPVGGIVLFFGIKGLSRKLIYTSVWGFASVIPFGLWLVRNMILSGTPMGVRFPTTFSLGENIQMSGGFIGRCFIMQGTNQFISGWFFISLLTAMTFGTLIFYFYKLIKTKEVNWAVISALLYIIFYFAAVVYAATTTSLGSFEDRYLIPSYPAIVMFMMFIMFALMKWVKTRKRVLHYTALVGMIAFLGFWLFTGLAYTNLICKRLSANGFGFANLSWKNSDTIGWLRANKLEGIVYTNDIQAGDLLANLNAKLLPAKPDFYKNVSENTKNELIERVEDFKASIDSGQRVYLVWYANHFRKYLYDPQELTQFCNMTLITRLPDGYIIALYPKNYSQQIK